MLTELPLAARNELPIEPPEMFTVLAEPATIFVPIVPPKTLTTLPLPAELDGYCAILIKIGRQSTHKCDGALQ
jgi:hypothetical protein